MDLAELGSLVDRLHKVRADRLAADKVVADLKAEETRLKNVIISELEERDLSSVGGKIAIVDRRIKHRAIASDWDDIRRYIVDNDAWDMMHRRLTDRAILDRIEAGEEIPGVSIMDYSDLTYRGAKL